MGTCFFSLASRCLYVLKVCFISLVVVCVVSESGFLAVFLDLIDLRLVVGRAAHRCEADGNRFRRIIRRVGIGDFHLGRLGIGGQDCAILTVYGLSRRSFCRRGVCNNTVCRRCVRYRCRSRWMRLSPSQSSHTFRTSTLPGRSDSRPRRKAAPTKAAAYHSLQKLPS